MGATYKNNIELTIFGESHGKAIGITIGNLPSGIQIDLDEVSRDMKRRAPGQNKMSTARKEADQVEILSGLQDGITTGAPLTGVIYNSDQHSKDYSLLKTNMRPGHSDYPAYIKYKGFNDVRGGGHFSGRITAPIVFAGNIAKQILKQKGICEFPTEDCAHISGNIIHISQPLTTSDVRVIKWLTGYTVDANFYESPKISEAWVKNKSLILRKKQ